MSRPPSADEAAAVAALLAKQRERLTAGKLNAVEVATGQNDPKALPQGLDAADAAAYTIVARALLNLDETITKE